MALYPVDCWFLVEAAESRGRVGPGGFLADGKLQEEVPGILFPIGQMHLEGRSADEVWPRSWEGTGGMSQ